MAGQSPCDWLCKNRRQAGCGGSISCHVKGKCHVFRLYLLIDSQKGAKHGEHGICVFSIGGVQDFRIVSLFFPRLSLRKG